MYSIEQIKQRMAELDAIWDDRGSTDATSEPEWGEYERLLYVLAEKTIKNNAE